MPQIMDLIEEAIRAADNAEAQGFHESAAAFLEVAAGFYQSIPRSKPPPAGWRDKIFPACQGQVVPCQ